MNHSMIRSFTLASLTAVCLILSADAHLQAAPRVSFELVTGNGFPLNGAQKWVNLFKNIAGTSVRIRAARGSETTTVENIGTDAFPSYHVVGILLGDNRLRLLGGKFTHTDRAKIAQWIKKLRSEGVDGLTAVRVAFGLTSNQLVAFHERVSRPLAFSTKGERAGDVVRKIVRAIDVPFDVSTAGRAAFARNEVVSDELKGITSGTALAATLRPLGLIWRPFKREDGQVILSIKETGEGEDSWPIGWPIKGTPLSTAPKLFESLKVEILDTPLSVAIDAIQPRVKLPFLFDYNSMARHRIDPATKHVNYPSRRVSYKRILDNVMFQAGLGIELRMDEVENPFLWISSTRR
jgi:hypothetical protein